MEKVKSIFYKTILTILAIFVTYSTICSIFNIYQAKENQSPIIIIIGTIVTVFLFINIKKICKKVPDEKANLVALILSLLFFIGLSVFGNLMSSIPTFDLSNLIKEAEIMINNGGKFVSEGYFSAYSNQVPLTILIYYIYKLGSLLNINNLKGFAIIINSLFMSVTAFFTYLSVKKIKDKDSGLTTLLFFVINPIFYLTASYFYADTLCMPFAAIAIFLVLLGKDEQNLKKKKLLQVAAGVVLAIGFKIRVVLGILLIAILMVTALDKKEKKWLNILTLLLGFMIGFGICTLLERNCEPIINKELKYPTTHWIMMGFNYKTDGRYNAEDFYDTKNSGEYSEKTQFTINKIKERTNEIGLKGIMPFLGTKLRVNWSNGSYDYLIKLLNVDNINNLYEYIVGNRRIFITYFYQIFKTTILFMVLLSIIKELKNKKDIDSEYNFIYIAIFGAFVFYLIWEVLTRYSLTFLPWMMILFTEGVEMFELSTNKIVEKFKVKRALQIFSALTILITMILIITNYNNYAVKKQEYSDKRVMQYSSEQGDAVSKIGQNNIQQTFIAKKSFNEIAIRMKKQNILNITHYNFILKDNFGKELVKQKFTSEQVEDGKLKIFKFKKIKPKGKNKYIIEIYSNDATDSNSIGIASFYQEGYDAYPDGTLAINSKQKNADLTFQVQNRVKRTYISKKLYILIGIIIILLEIFAFYPYLNYNSRDKFEN